MLTVTICIGSSCYVRGSDNIAETFEKMIDQNGLDEQVELVGSFCMEHCSMGVSVRVGDTIYQGVDPEDAEVFFINEVMPQVGNGNHP
jgi:NADH:ubiquinone oxidoreductase subunit E